ncbi:cell division protein ZipA C-terminal FtsZ-binding domain-containing protein [Dechloromonas sp. XY25]|uniref:Cell division protein ZipA n=1 Tax=Dechloromonas hankyongensis TaxID=2908002 RepID=A0ABS9K415_9RHOO|nr:cell division protein ZipA C-terminal FtsZ-binding domain-containing protein [Dechloromonas hankyongensis]MCG2577881.1 cell division protein ZipA C-terminal FtsZ-binding domain-containing protein [Dechloromonas hankyongensis]
MTELQMGLIGLGAAAVVGVFGYNKWQEIRQRKIAEAVMKPQHEDVLLAKEAKAEVAAVAPVERSEPEIRFEAPEPVERLEPVFSDPTPSEAVADVPMLEAEEPVVPEPAPVVEPVAKAVAEPVASPPVASPEPAEPMHEVEAGDVPAELLDPRLEYIVAMELVEPVSSIQILHSQRSTLHRLNKPVLWVGYNEKAREWQRLSPDVDLDVRRLRVGLQLVNRLGPVSEGDLVIFANAMQALADELMAVADMPPSRVLDQAAEIDRFCAAVDLEIGLNLVSRSSAFPGTKIRALSEAAGMVLGIDGLFTRYDDAGRAQFSLQNFESTPFSADSLRTVTTHGLTFLLDVPRVDHGERVFMQMSEVAKRFADTLQGALVDDNRQPLSDTQLEHIRREFIGKPQATMASFGLAAGSAQALRLFS